MVGLRVARPWIERHGLAREPAHQGVDMRTPWFPLFLALGGLILCGCGDDDGGGGQLIDSGGVHVDAEVQADVGPQGDTGPPADAGRGDDAGPQGDGARPLDAAPPVDATEPLDAAAPTDTDPSADQGPTRDAEPGVDVAGDTGPPPDAGPPLTLELTPTLSAPVDPLGGDHPDSCPVYLQERCVEGRLQRCALYDPAAEGLVAQPDPLLHRALLYDRWYDLHGSPDGQTAERLFTQSMEPETPEEVWAAREHFAGWAGLGDSAIWTGVALTADAFRYAVTGTEADYQRMERRVRTLLTMFDVTGVPGYLARYHFLWLPAGTPRDPQHVFQVEGQDALGRRDMPSPDPDAIPDLPESYRQEVPGPDGQPVRGQVYWHGHPSIDQYSGPMVAFPIVYHLLRDEELKARIVRHMTCYLHRLERIEIINLRDNPEILQLVTDYFAGGSLTLDPDDIDLLDTDRIVAYVNRGINPDNQAEFDGSCPDFVQMEPGRLLDARDPDFFPQLFDVAYDMMEEGDPRATQIDHFYVPTVRGGDASHMMHLAVMAYDFTGDERYLRFLQDELIGEFRTIGVAHTMQALRLPDSCFKYYGDHITYGTHWQLVSTLPDSMLRSEMVRVMHAELWNKALHNHHSAKFDLMYATAGSDEELPAREQAIASAVRQLQLFGGGGEVIDSPRRTYHLERQWVIDRMGPAGIGLRCPTEEERTACEDGPVIMGMSLGGKEISHDCDGRPGECVMEDGRCTEALADDGLPPRLRKYADFMWQRSPFQVGEGRGDHGRKQSPGRDLAEPYWMARYYGFIEQGVGQVLAWQDGGAVCE